jgi:hypothetical protein
MAPYRVTALRYPDAGHLIGGLTALLDGLMHLPRSAPPLRVAYGSPR